MVQRPVPTTENRQEYWFMFFLDQTVEIQVSTFLAEVLVEPTYNIYTCTQGRLTAGVCEVWIYGWYQDGNAMSFLPSECREQHSAPDCREFCPSEGKARPVHWRWATRLPDWWLQLVKGEHNFHSPCIPSSLSLSVSVPPIVPLFIHPVCFIQPSVLPHTLMKMFFAALAGVVWEWCEWYSGWWDGSRKDDPVYSDHSLPRWPRCDGAFYRRRPTLHGSKLGLRIPEIRPKGMTCATVGINYVVQQKFCEDNPFFLS